LYPPELQLQKATPATTPAPKAPLPSILRRPFPDPRRGAGARSLPPSAPSCCHPNPLSLPTPSPHHPSGGRCIHIHGSCHTLEEGGFCVCELLCTRGGRRFFFPGTLGGQTTTQIAPKLIPRTHTELTPNCFLYIMALIRLVSVSQQSLLASAPLHGIGGRRIQGDPWCPLTRCSRLGKPWPNPPTDPTGPKWHAGPSKRRTQGADPKAPRTQNERNPQINPYFFVHLVPLRNLSLIPFNTCEPHGPLPPTPDQRTGPSAPPPAVHSPHRHSLLPLPSPSPPGSGRIPGPPLPQAWHPEHPIPIPYPPNTRISGPRSGLTAIHN